MYTRPMHPNDLEDVYAIEMANHVTPWTKEILKDCMLVGYDCYVLLHDDLATSILGFIICRHNATTCHILNLCIHKPFQNKGYGYFLLNTVLNTLVTTSMDTILLEVRVSNKPAIQLYEKLGFAIIETKKGYYVDDGSVEDAYQLGKFI